MSRKHIKTEATGRGMSVIVRKGDLNKALRILKKRLTEDGVEMVMPGDNVTLEVKLINPIAMEKGLRFAIREGGRTVGAGQVTEIIA